MCGRFANQLESKEAWEEYFGTPLPAEFLEEVAIGYNIAPTQMIPVVTKEGWLATRWGMIAPWSSEISSKFATFNARSETVAEKATFRGAWNDGRRCVVPALGYYEWKKEGEEKQPYFVNAASASPICFGGLYEPAREATSGAGIPASCTIITLPASDAMASLHHRMPLMFSDPTAWLESNSFDGHLNDLSWHAVDKTVNNPRNQGSKLIHK
jgi:putative SOS response-associated peptidase YedK